MAWRIEKLGPNLGAAAAGSRIEAGVWTDADPWAVAAARSSAEGTADGAAGANR